MSTIQQQPPELKAYNDKMNQLQDVMLNRQRLLTQKNENEMVKKELEILEDDDIIYKLEDGELKEEDPLEAEMCVDQRLEYLESELKKCDVKEADLQAQVKECQKKLADIQKAALAGQSK
ncbi:hypothetical protein ENUP19_0052G0047 [Entamoeba nuttalli]|uniref:Prefoldin subunit 6, putative n=2 Tax=Entamoeba nuttalli TaxID=412467 RepID=K2GHL7_ENTNP|nr:prefoldin subunit 6, putative [Entamoeba nuttalli P19]EKE42181.1 prefoldin subunit 6, putative [Entamoeba nuttalli P19]|eukprot:XP_008855481.1 prefoldin subunit 6, putative [Entamoeba nuttalli P19]